MIDEFRSLGSGVPDGKGGVTGAFSADAWHAAIRGLPCDQGLSDRILFHHSTVNHSRIGSSMSLAKFILSHNGCRVSVCMRRLLPIRDLKVRGGSACTSDHGGFFWAGWVMAFIFVWFTWAFI